MDAYLNIVCFSVANIDANGAVIAEGEEVMELSADGRIAKVFTFWGPLPSTPTSWPRQLIAPRQLPRLNVDAAAGDR